jgi:site-specific DNA-methyltransferase (adenine-specific)
LFSCKSDEYPTPQAVVDEWARRVGPFSLDPCCTKESAKASRFFMLEDNGLAQDWHTASGGGAVWMNPPYSDCEAWVAKAIAESARGCTVVTLLPARTDVGWFHLALAAQPRAEFYFCRGRLRFEGAEGSAPFPSVVIVFRPGVRR